MDPLKLKSSYSNLNFVLLGFVIENVTGIPYAEYIETSILEPLGMTMSSFKKSNDSFAVLPKLPENQFGWSNYCKQYLLKVKYLNLVDS